MMSTLMDRLSNDQLASFDVEQVDDKLWRVVAALIERDFPDGQFRFIDMGGGNGLFADRVLAAYPRCTGTVLDASDFMLGKNTYSPRKSLICADATEVATCGKADLVFCNWFLHHLVTTGDYQRTRRNQVDALREIKGALTARGRVSIFEPTYNGFVDNLPSRVIFAVTSSRTLRPFAKAMRANTAGVGVCFLSMREWSRTFAEAGLTVVNEWTQRGNRPRLLRRLQFAALAVRERKRAHFWLS